jgi:DNA-binding transcriptional regulator YdaS (Cro superfamily)
MNLATALDARRGLTAEIAKALGIAPAYLSQMANGTRPVPAAVAPALERELSFEVRRWDLRPKDWHLIWPELIGADGAPEPAPAEQPAQGAAQINVEVRDAA